MLHVIINFRGPEYWKLSKKRKTDCAPLVSQVHLVSSAVTGSTVLNGNIVSMFASSQG